MSPAKQRKFRFYSCITAVQYQRLFRFICHVLVDVNQTFLAPVKHLNGIIASVQMLQYFGYNLSLCTGVFFAHRTVDQFDNIFVKMCNEVIQIFIMRFGVQSFTPDPLNCVSEMGFVFAKNCRLCSM